MLELASDLGLLDETPDHRGIPGMSREEHLHGDVATQVGVASHEDEAHSAAGDLAQDMVTPLPATGESCPHPARRRPGAMRRRVRRTAWKAGNDAGGLSEDLQHTTSVRRGDCRSRAEGCTLEKHRDGSRARCPRTIGKDRLGRSWNLALAVVGHAVHRNLTDPTFVPFYAVALKAGCDDVEFCVLVDIRDGDVVGAGPAVNGEPGGGVKPRPSPNNTTILPICRARYDRQSRQRRSAILSRSISATTTANAGIPSRNSIAAAGVNLPLAWLSKTLNSAPLIETTSR